jgi:hypothetical protein
MLMLSLLSLMRWQRAETVFMAVFVTSAWLFAVAVQLPRWRATAGIATALRPAIEEVGRFTPPQLIAQMTARPNGVLLLLGYAIALLPLVIALLAAVEQVLTGAYVHIHRGISQGSGERRAVLPERGAGLGGRLDYERMSHALRFLPLPIRALLARDALCIVRTPFLLLKTLSVLIPLGLLPFLRTAAVQESLVFDLYSFSAFLSFQLFTYLVASDIQSGAPMRRAFRSGPHYIASRVVTVFVTSLAIAFPLWAVVGTLAGWGGPLYAIARTLLLMTNLLAASLLVVPYLVVFSRDRRVGGGTFESVHPLALVLFAAFGMCGPAFFYLLDLVIRGTRPSLGCRVVSQDWQRSCLSLPSAGSPHMMVFGGPSV